MARGRSLSEWFQSHTRIQRWLNGRLPPIHSIILTQQQIFIFLSREGLLFLILLFITFIAGINYANNLVLGFCFFLASVLVIGIHHTFQNLSGLQVQWMDAQDAEAWTRTRVRLRVGATRHKTHQHIQLLWEGEKHWLTTAQAPQIVEFELPVGQRGPYGLPRLHVETVFPLGLLRAWTYVRFQSEVWVWPQSTEVNRVGTGASTNGEQQVESQRVAGMDDFEGLDTYQPGQPLTRISWRHLAQGKGWFIKTFSDPVSQHAELHYEQMPGPGHEERLSQLMYLVYLQESQQQPYRIHLPDQQSPLGVGEAQLALVRRLLAQCPPFSEDRRI